MSIAIPSPAVVVLVGAAGAGKSTLARRLFDPEDIVSSDDLRGAIRGDPTDQSLTRVAFSILHRELVRRLARRQTVVVDATNLTHAGRVAILRRAAIAGIPVVGIVLVPPAADVHARNAARPSGVVPADAVDRQLATAAALGADRRAIVERLAAEGFAAVHVLASAEEIAAVNVERLSR
ncbi:MAG TPA: ATP-binding protein [Candidatus Limnocylindrales bacterium]